MAKGETCPNGILVEPMYGEKARRLLISLGLLDKGKRIAQHNDKLVLPLKKVDGRSIPKLKIPSCEFIRHEFATREIRPRNIREALGKILSSEEIKLLGSSYDVVGGIMLIELSEELVARRREIGNTLLNWLSVETVALKTSPTCGERRIKGYEVIAGKDSLETTHRENGLKFKVDLSKVFFNPRLGGERARVAKLSKMSSLIIDMFAGVGSFSITIDKISNIRGSKIYAVDSNPHAIGFLLENARLNRSRGVIGICGDSKEEAPRIVGQAGRPDRIIMNLPGSSDKFLPTAADCLRTGGWIHYYRLATKAEARRWIEDELASVGSFDVDLIREVESYSPSKSIFVADAKLQRRT